MSIFNPTNPIISPYTTSINITKHLTSSIIKKEKFNINTHSSEAKLYKTEHEKERTNLANEILHNNLSKLDTTTKRRITRGGKTGAWLSVNPRTINGLTLSPQEFRDGLAIRYNTNPINLPKKCDGCGEDYNINHALN